MSNWVEWYARNGLQEPGKKMKPFLAPKRKPKGVEHSKVEVETFYRTPMYADSHASVDGDTALCGRPLEVDELWWIDSGWEGALGPYYLIVEERKNGTHGECERALKNLRERGKLPSQQVVTKVASPFKEKEDIELAKMKAKMMRLRALAGPAAAILRAFPGSEVVDD